MTYISKILFVKYADSHFVVQHKKIDAIFAKLGTFIEIPFRKKLKATTVKRLIYYKI